ncbi:hypothetical protein Q4E93_25390 [Flavitalea sp. BT771]|uniref:hypothetical protein n=1 Tax=Flavitalea sp. BT771 TaxID=3063329 RepID=UPI0026E2FE3D|nr:hypothetical protein [Flavitalea sp. BT771]MDO6433967.1 hypothetical protein [Flavitalea sp. BT771]MDV6222867.1 hypothetical protein [Flavitalea sp. BT771]
MKKHFQISLIIMAIAFLIAIFAALKAGMEGFVIAFGSICCLGGLGCLVAGLFLMIDKKSREDGQAVLLSAGITLLIGTGVCSTLLMG